MLSSLHSGWSSRNRERLELLLEHPSQGNYAVFDWDNTCVFLDVEEATLVYQLDRICFAAEPDCMMEALRQGVPQEDEVVVAHLQDIDESYRWLWPRYNGLFQYGSHESVEGSPAHHNFRAKLLNLYAYLEHNHGAEVAYTWMPFRYAGMTAQQVRKVTAEAVRWQLQQPIETVRWQSAGDGRTGAVSVEWRSGLRLLPEIQSLHRALLSAGVDVWVCTASFVEGIREIASSEEFGYGLSPERVIGLQLEEDAQARFLPCRKVGSEITYAEGKTEAVRRILHSRYGRGPILVAGDSNGDAPMLRDFEDTRLSLIIDTNRPTDTPIGELATLAREGHPRYLLQSRDEVNGCWMLSS